MSVAEALTENRLATPVIEKRRVGSVAVMVRPPESVKKRAVAMYLRGVPIMEIAERLDVAPSNIQPWVRRAGHEPNRRTFTTERKAALHERIAYLETRMDDLESEVRALQRRRP